MRFGFHDWPRQEFRNRCGFGLRGGHGCECGCGCRCGFHDLHRYNFHSRRLCNFRVRYGCNFRIRHCCGFRNRHGCGCHCWFRDGRRWKFRSKRGFGLHGRGRIGNRSVVRATRVLRHCTIHFRLADYPGMQFPELGKKFRAHGVFNIDHLQAGRDTLADFRHDHSQFAPLVERMFRFDAPDEQVHGFQRVLPDIASLAVHDVHNQQNLDPLLDQKFEHGNRHVTSSHARLDFRLRHGFGKREPFFLLDAIRCGQRVLFDTLIFFGDERLQPLARGVEDLQVGLEAIDEFLEDALHAPEQRARGVEVNRQAQRNLAQRIEQLPRRMGLLREERLVRDRDLEHRDLQAANEPLHADGDLGIIEQLIEHQGHDVERQHVQLVHAGAHAGVFQPAQDIGDARLAGGVRRGDDIARHRTHVAKLYAGEQSQQFRTLEHRLHSVRSRRDPGRAGNGRTCSSGGACLRHRVGSQVFQD